MTDFLQSSQWSKFWQESNNPKNHRIIRRNGIIVYEYPWLLGFKFWYLPRTNLDLNNPEDQQKFEKIKNLAQKDSKIIFLQFGLDASFSQKYQDLETLKLELESNLKEKLVISRKKLQWCKTSILDLNDLILPNENLDLENLTVASLQDFLAKNTEFFKQRNENVRRYTKKSLTSSFQVISQKTTANFEKFYTLMQQTATRQGFFLHPKDYYKALFEKDFSYLFLLEDENGQPQSAWFGVYLEQTLVYLYGANSENSLAHKGQYLDHLIALWLGKSLNAQFYDLGGVEETKGYGQFKLNYHGKLINYWGELDLPLQKTTYFAINWLLGLKNFFKQK
jgi:lipid II:glycine glycyltransferase (peptidoglycan interpeptide bridge formation enzyme)